MVRHYAFVLLAILRPANIQSKAQTTLGWLFID